MKWSISLVSLHLNALRGNELPSPVSHFLISLITSAACVECSLEAKVVKFAFGIALDVAD
jgi:hypothetical protein